MKLKDLLKKIHAETVVIIKVNGETCYTGFADYLRNVEYIAKSNVKVTVIYTEDNKIVVDIGI